MTNRTLNFYGLGFGAETATITVSGTNDGIAVPVYSGTVPTVNEALPMGAYYPPGNYQLLFTMQIPVDFAGNFPMTITVNSGFGVAFASVTGNYQLLPNPVYSAEQLQTVESAPRSSAALSIYTSLASPAFTAEEIAVLNDPNTTNSVFYQLINTHGLEFAISGGPSSYSAITPDDCRTNVALNGVAQQAPDPRAPGETGTWTWMIPAAGTLTYSLNTLIGKA